MTELARGVVNDTIVEMLLWDDNRMKSRLEVTGSRDEIRKMSANPLVAMYKPVEITRQDHHA